MMKDEELKTLSDLLHDVKTVNLAVDIISQLPEVPKVVMNIVFDAFDDWLTFNHLCIIEGFNARIKMDYSHICKLLRTLFREKDYVNSQRDFKRHKPCRI